MKRNRETDELVAETEPRPASGSSVNIAVELRRAIVSGHFAFGEKLPPERELATLYNASRNTVRESLRRLEESSLVSRKMGSGTFVTHKIETGRDDAAGATSPLELIEVRFAVEPHMTRLAVQNAGSRDLSQLESALQRLENTTDDPKRFSRADEAFHLCLAECSRNPLMLWLYRQVNEVRGNTLWFDARNKILTPETIAQYNKEHRKLFNAIRARHVEQAVNIISDHLEHARKHLIGVSSEDR
ncbi:MAG: FadR family transcriptional regulator [Rhodospirillales bacterium]|jgi:DNA-binding FadR family transcriptional regulator|nr:FadR family transcriptional regulator [Rhodospirillales bacterium]